MNARCKCGHTRSLHRLSGRGECTACPANGKTHCGIYRDALVKADTRPTGASAANDDGRTER